MSDSRTEERTPTQAEPAIQTREEKKPPAADQNGSSGEGIFASYGQQDWPMAAYAGLVAVYAASFAAFVALAKKTGRPLPDKIDPVDVILFGVATQRLSRLLTKDWVLAPLRAPFTQYQGPGGPGEVREKARGKGLRMAVGELLTCPWCTAQWVATGFTYGFVFSPRLARLVARIFATVSISDFLNLAYSAAEK